MKYVVKKDDIELSAEFASIEEWAKLGEDVVSQMLRTIQRHDSKSLPLNINVGVPDSDLLVARSDEIAAYLQSSPPITATALAEHFKDEPLFKVPSGDPIHVIRRILREDEERFAKTLSGLFTLKSRLEHDRNRYVHGSYAAHYENAILSERTELEKLLMEFAMTGNQADPPEETAPAQSTDIFADELDNPFADE